MTAYARPPSDPVRPGDTWSVVLEVHEWASEAVDAIKRYSDDTLEVLDAWVDQIAIVGDYAETSIQQWRLTITGQWRRAARSGSALYSHLAGWLARELRISWRPVQFVSTAIEHTASSAWGAVTRTFWWIVLALAILLWIWTRNGRRA